MEVGKEGKEKRKGNWKESQKEEGGRHGWTKKGDREDSRKRDRKKTEMAKKAVHGILLGTA